MKEKVDVTDSPPATVANRKYSAGRMSTMSGNDPPQTFYLAAGALFTCAGWIDTVLYTITRRTLLFQELGSRRRTRGGGSNPNRRDYFDSSGRSRASRAYPQSSQAFPRASSTDSILGGSDGGMGGGDGRGSVGGGGGGGIAKLGGITVEQTVNVVLEDMESPDGRAGTGVESNCVRVTTDAPKGAGVPGA